MVSQCTTMTSMHHHDFMEDAQLVEYLRPVGLQENAICPLPLSSRMTSLSGADFAEPSLPDGALPGHAKSNHWKPTVATSGRRTSFISGRVASAGEPTNRQALQQQALVRWWRGLSWRWPSRLGSLLLDSCPRRPATSFSPIPICQSSH